MRQPDIGFWTKPHPLLKNRIMKKKTKPHRATRVPKGKNRTSLGKIACLPGSIREEVCRRMFDTHPPGAMLEWLNSLPAVQAVIEARFSGIPISHGNLQCWRHQGYQAWLKRHDLAARSEQLAQVAANITRNSGITLAASAAQLTAGKLLELLEEFDHAAHPPAASAASSPPVPDTKALLDIARALAALRNAEQKDAQLAAGRQRIVQLDRQIVLARQKFEYETVERLLSLLNDDRIRAIGTGDFDNTAKIEALGQLMFGPDWRGGAGNGNEGEGRNAEP